MTGEVRQYVCRIPISTVKVKVTFDTLMVKVSRNLVTFKCGDLANLILWIPTTDIAGPESKLLVAGSIDLHLAWSNHD